MVRHHLYVSAWVCVYVCVYECVWRSESILTVHPLNLRHTLLQTCSFHILRLFYYDRTHRHLWHNKTERLNIKHDEFLGDEDNCCQRAGLANSSLHPATLTKLWYWWHTGAKFKSRVPKPPNRNPRVTRSQVHKADQSENFYIFKPKTPLLQDLNRGAEGSDRSSWKQPPVPFLRSLTRRPHIAPEELWVNPTLTLSYRSILATSESPESATLSVGLRRVPKNALRPLRTSHFEVNSTSSPSEVVLMLPDVDHSWNICLHYTWHVKGQLQKHSHFVI